MLQLAVGLPTSILIHRNECFIRSWVKGGVEFWVEVIAGLRLECSERVRVMVMDGF